MVQPKERITYIDEDEKQNIRHHQKNINKTKLKQPSDNETMQQKNHYQN